VAVSVPPQLRKQGHGLYITSVIEIHLIAEGAAPVTPSDADGKLNAAAQTLSWFDGMDCPVFVIRKGLD
jgi:hypothetical protein